MGTLMIVAMRTCSTVPTIAAPAPTAVTGWLPPACDMSAKRKWGKLAKTTGAPLKITYPMTAVSTMRPMPAPVQTVSVANLSFISTSL